MGKHRISLGKVDVSRLQTDEDFKREAKRLMPAMLKQVGRTVAEVAWKELQQALRGTGFEANKSPSEKRKFIEEGGRNYHREADAKTKKELEDHIVEQLRELKGTG